MGSIGWPELLIVLGIVLLIFGPKRLPGLGKQLGSGMRDFKDAVTGKDKREEEEDAARQLAAANVREAAEGQASAEKQPAEQG